MNSSLLSFFEYQDRALFNLKLCNKLLPKPYSIYASIRKSADVRTHAISESETSFSKIFLEDYMHMSYKISK